MGACSSKGAALAASILRLQRINNEHEKPHSGGHSHLSETFEENEKASKITLAEDTTTAATSQRESDSSRESKEQPNKSSPKTKKKKQNDGKKKKKKKNKAKKKSKSKKHKKKKQSAADTEVTEYDDMAGHDMDETLYYIENRLSERSFEDNEEYYYDEEPISYRSEMTDDSNLSDSFAVGKIGTMTPMNATVDWKGGSPPERTPDQAVVVEITTLEPPINAMDDSSSFPGPSDSNSSFFSGSLGETVLKDPDGSWHGNHRDKYNPPSMSPSPRRLSRSLPTRAERTNEKPNGQEQPQDIFGSDSDKKIEFYEDEEDEEEIPKHSISRSTSTSSSDFNDIPKHSISRSTTASSSYDDGKINPYSTFSSEDDEEQKMHSSSYLNSSYLKPTSSITMEGTFKSVSATDINEPPPLTPSRVNPLKLAAHLGLDPGAEDPEDDESEVPPHSLLRMPSHMSGSFSNQHPTSFRADKPLHVEPHSPSIQSSAVGTFSGMEFDANPYNDPAISPLTVTINPLQYNKATIASFAPSRAATTNNNRSMVQPSKSPKGGNKAGVTPSKSREGTVLRVQSSQGDLPIISPLTFAGAEEHEEGVVGKKKLQISDHKRNKLSRKHADSSHSKKEKKKSKKSQTGKAGKGSKSSSKHDKKKKKHEKKSKSSRQSEHSLDNHKDDDMAMDAQDKVASSKSPVSAARSGISSQRSERTRRNSGRDRFQSPTTYGQRVGRDDELSRPSGRRSTHDDSDDDESDGSPIVLTKSRHEKSPHRGHNGSSESARRIRMIRYVSSHHRTQGSKGSGLSEWNSDSDENSFAEESSARSERSEFINKMTALRERLDQAARSVGSSPRSRASKVPVGLEPDENGEILLNDVEGEENISSPRRKGKKRTSSNTGSRLSRWDSQPEVRRKTSKSHPTKEKRHRKSEGGKSEHTHSSKGTKKSKSSSGSREKRKKKRA